MPLYYFDLRVVLDDPQGSDLPDEQRAIAEASASGRVLLADGEHLGQDRRDWSISVKDASGVELAAIRLGDLGGLRVHEAQATNVVVIDRTHSVKARRLALLATLVGTLVLTTTVAAG